MPKMINFSISYGNVSAIFSLELSCSLKSEFKEIYFSYVYIYRFPIQLIESFSIFWDFFLMLNKEWEKDSMNFFILFARHETSIDTSALKELLHLSEKSLSLMRLKAYEYHNNWPGNGNVIPWKWTTIWISHRYSSFFKSGSLRIASIVPYLSFFWNSLKFIHAEIFYSLYKDTINPLMRFSLVWYRFQLQIVEFQHQIEILQYLSRALFKIDFDWGKIEIHSKRS